MLQTESTHYDSVHTNPADIWPGRSATFRPVVNKELLEEVATNAKELAQAPTSNGKRRAIEDAPAVERGKKRIKTNGGAASPPPTRDAYPELKRPHQVFPLEPISAETQREDVPVLNHVFDIHIDGLRCNTLAEIDGAALRLCEFDGRVVVCVEAEGKLRWLLLLPPWATQDTDDYDYGATPAVSDLAYACLILADARKIDIQITLSVIDADHIQLSLLVSLRLPFIFQPCARKVTKKNTTLVENSQRRLIAYIYGRDRDGIEPTAVSITHFYSILSAAQSLSSRAADAAMQPKALLPTLLPFQRRSVGWLLEREGLEVHDDGSIHPRTNLNDFLYSFWDEVSEGNHTWFYNRLSGELSPDNPNPDIDLADVYMEKPPLGGILAEEPGLGKTLETISLMLLNPAPESRNPSVTRWDPEARLDVKAIKTTLIVTPPSLSNQWIDELRAHAPSLKVLVYDGWSKVKVPITKPKPDAVLSSELEAQLKQAAASGTWADWSSSGASTPAIPVATRSKRGSTGQTTPTTTDSDTTRKGKGRAPKKEKPLTKAQLRKLEMEEKKRAALTMKAKENAVSRNLDDMADSMRHDSEGNLLDWCEFVQQFDVVVTTYQTLKGDFNVARAAPVRPRREDVVYTNYERPRSPLVMVEWNRVVMDEVQMVGGGNVEDMVSLIPRLSSLAVSGTPAKAQISDMIHVLKFLRIHETIGPAKLWARLLKPGFSHEFAAFFNRYTIRTTKASVKDELTIPQQTRFLVPITLGKVERHVYDQTLEAVLLDLGLDARGVAANDGWEIDAAVLRTAIRRLRGICTHPQVGQLQGRGDTYKRGALKTMDAVLSGMRDSTWRAVMEHWKGKVQTMVRYAQLVQRAVGIADRYPQARDTLLAAEEEAKAHITEIDAALVEHRAAGEILKAEAAAAAKQAATANEGATGKGKGKERDGVDSSDDESEEEENVEDKGLPKTPAGKEHRAKTQAMKARLREMKLVLHQVKFLQGDLYNQFGQTHSHLEDAAYAEAEQIRKDLLKVTEDKAVRAMDILQGKNTNKRPMEDELEIPLPFLEPMELDEDDMTKALFEKMNEANEKIEEASDIVENVLNAQTDLLFEWRTRIMLRLTEKLNAGDEADGGEYQRNLDNQGEAEVFLQAYAALLSDRRQALINERTMLAQHDAREKRVRHTKAAMKAAKALDMLKANDFDGKLELPTEFDVRAEDQVQHKLMMDERRQLVNLLEGRSLKSVLVDLNGLHAQVGGMRDAEEEKNFLTAATKAIRGLMASQGALHDKLDADLALMRDAFNDRILYFRQLQEISDSVAPVEWEEPSIDAAVAACVEERTEHEGSMNTNRARHRYLVNLHAENSKGAASTEDDEENICILCRCDFVRGYITQCAHIFCEVCMKAWLGRPEGKACPVCRVGINPDTIQRFTIAANDPAVQRQPHDSGEMIKSSRKIEYNVIDPSLFDRILGMEAYGDFGTKIQTLVKHLLFLQSTEPGTKSIVFSAWADSLHIVECALSNNGIRSLRIDQKSKGQSAAKMFKSDPGILVLLLHGERENAGLNVTCASRVFLLESVVHHSFELQAIARIDRMGQTRSTEVFCYYAEDTVERNILDLAARKGLSLYTKGNSAGTVDVSSFNKDIESSAVDSPSKNKKQQKQQKGDFIFKLDDMLAVLFPHMYEDIEFLIPSTEDAEMEDFTAPTSYSPSRTNAVAGPSRLR